MIEKTLFSSSGVNIVLGLVTEEDSNAKANFAAKGLPDIAQGTCLDHIIDRPLKTPLQYLARILAYCELHKQGKKMLNSAHISLSHTPGAVAFASGSPDFIKSVGIDIEHKKRCIESELEKYYFSPMDCHAGLDRLSIWCLKEAALKCLDAFQCSLLMNDITIRPLSMGRFFCEVLDRSCTVELVNHECDYVVAVAWY